MINILLHWNYLTSISAIKLRNSDTFKNMLISGQMLEFTITSFCSLLFIPILSEALKTTYLGIRP